jgi:hypothetical protein
MSEKVVRLPQKGAVLSKGSGLTYDGGTGDGGGGMLEMRIGRLEADMTEVKADLKVVRSDLAELKGKVSMLPGYGGIALIVGTFIAASTVVQIVANLMSGATP